MNIRTHVFLLKDLGRNSSTVSAKMPRTIQSSQAKPNQTKPTQLHLTMYVHCIIPFSQVSLHHLFRQVCFLSRYSQREVHLLSTTPSPTGLLLLRRSSKCVCIHIPVIRWRVVGVFNIKADNIGCGMVFVCYQHFIEIKCISAHKCLRDE